MAEMTYGTLELMICGSDQTILKGFARTLGFDVESTYGLKRRKLSKVIRDFINETLRRISIQCILSSARQIAIDLQTGHAHFEFFGSTNRARNHTKK